MKWTAALLLAIMVPLSLLVAFRITGLFHGPLSISETKVLETAKLEVERPDDMVDIIEGVNSTYEDEYASLNCSIFEYDIISNILHMRLDLSVAIVQGFVSNINLTFWEDFEDSQINFGEIWQPSRRPQFSNLSLGDYVDFQQERGLKGFIELTGENQSKRVHFYNFMEWWLSSPQNYTHQMAINVEFIYFNGTAYREIIQPFQLRLGPDSNNSFDTSTQLAMQDYLAKQYIGGDDKADYYQVNVPQGHMISIEAKAADIDGDVPSFYVLLYDPQRTERVKSGWDYNVTIDYVSDIAGDWFIKVLQAFDWSSGYYDLSIDVFSS